MTEPSKLAEALTKVQARLKPIKRNSKGQAGNRPHKYSGLDIVSDEVLPLLTEHGLSFSAKPTMHPEFGFVLAYVLRHVGGERDDGYWPLNASANAQGRGSEISYARRYCLQAITGATSVGEDDDGHESASQTRPARPQRTRTRIPGPDHERLRHPEPEERVNGQKAARSRAPEDGSQWQDLPEEDRPGTATDGQITHIQITYKEMGFKPSERELMLHASEWIIGRPLGGPNGDRTHKNLSFNEARKLGDTLDSTDRAHLEEDLAAAGA